MASKKMVLTFNLFEEDYKKLTDESDKLGVQYGDISFELDEDTGLMTAFCVPFIGKKKDLLNLAFLDHQLHDCGGPSFSEEEVLDVMEAA